GPMPPTDGLDATFAPVVERLMPAFNLKARIDSIVPYTLDTYSCPNGASFLNTCWRAYMTFERDGQVTQSVADGYTPFWYLFEDETETEFVMGSGTVQPSPEVAQQFGLPANFPGFIANVVGTFPQSIIYSQ